MIAKAGIIIAIIGSIIIFIYMYFVKKDKKKCLISLISAISLGLIGVIALLIFKPSFFSDYFSNYSFNTLKSRIEIYKSALSLFKLNPLFGIGYYGSFNWYVDSWTGIQFAHNTFLEMMVVGGIFGTICLIYHLVDKYSRLLYHMNFEKIILLLSFSLVGLYGLIDVTYFLLPYTAVLIFQMLLSDTLVEESNPKWLINTK